MYNASNFAEGIGSANPTGTSGHAIASTAIQSSVDGFLCPSDMPTSIRRRTYPVT